MSKSSIIAEIVRFTETKKNICKLDKENLVFLISDDTFDDLEMIAIKEWYGKELSIERDYAEFSYPNVESYVPLITKREKNIYKVIFNWKKTLTAVDDFHKKKIYFGYLTSDMFLEINDKQVIILNIPIGDANNSSEVRQNAVKKILIQSDKKLKEYFENNTTTNWYAIDTYLLVEILFNSLEDKYKNTIIKEIRKKAQLFEFKSVGELKEEIESLYTLALNIIYEKEGNLFSLLGNANVAIDDGISRVLQSDRELFFPFIKKDDQMKKFIFNFFMPNQDDKVVTKQNPSSTSQCIVIHDFKNINPSNDIGYIELDATFKQIRQVFKINDDIFNKYNEFIYLTISNNPEAKHYFKKGEQIESSDELFALLGGLTKDKYYSDKELLEEMFLNIIENISSYSKKFKAFIHEIKFDNCKENKIFQKRANMICEIELIVNKKQFFYETLRDVLTNDSFPFIQKKKVEVLEKIESNENQIEMGSYDKWYVFLCYTYLMYLSAYEGNLADCMIAIKKSFAILQDINQVKDGTKCNDLSNEKKFNSEFVDNIKKGFEENMIEVFHRLSETILGYRISYNMEQNRDDPNLDT